MFYVLWSPRQSRFHVESEATMFHNNMRAFSMGTRCDYLPLVKFQTTDECVAFIADIKDTAGVSA